MGGATVASSGAAPGVCEQLDMMLRRFGADAEVRSGAPADGPCRLGGPPVVATVAPRDEAAVAAVIRAAREHGWTLVARGAGSRDRWGGRIARGPLVALDMRALQGIVVYEPGDLTVRVRPGTSIAALNDTLKVHGQVLPSAAPRTRRSTIGGVVAADAWGPNRLGDGGPRDLMLGLRAVDGGARVFAAGGHVVKNVSGLDIGKLFVGSFGSLGVITELSLKLRPRAPRREFWGAVFPDPGDAWSAARRILDGPFQPVGLTLGERDDGASLVVCVQGGTAEVTDQIAGLPAFARGATGLSADEARRCWEADREVEPEADEALAVRCELAEGELEELAREVAGLPYPLRRVAWPGLGVLWCVLDGPAAAGMPAGECLPVLGRLRDLASARGGRAVVAACPEEARAEALPFGDPGELLPWYRAIKHRFDPDGILAPGRFVGGL